MEVFKLRIFIRHESYLFLYVDLLRKLARYLANSWIFLGREQITTPYPSPLKNSNNDVLSVIAVVAMGSCNETAAAAVAVCIISVDEHWAPLL